MADSRWTDNSGFKFTPLPKQYSEVRIRNVLKAYGLDENEINNFISDLDDKDNEKEIKRVFGV